MMREKLERLVRKWRRRSTKLLASDQAAKEALDGCALDACELLAESAWIPAFDRERQPEFNQLVWVGWAKSKRCILGSLNSQGGGWWQDEDLEYLDPQPDVWQPLEKPPPFTG